MSTTFEEIQKRIIQHLEERDWHTNPPRSIAISIVLEATELLEHYQWSEESIGDKEDLAEELADVIIYSLQLADNLDIDVVDAIYKKLEKTAKKYPAENFKGASKEEQHTKWIQNKLDYKKDGL